MRIKDIDITGHRGMPDSLPKRDTIAGSAFLKKLIRFSANKTKSFREVSDLLSRRRQIHEEIARLSAMDGMVISHHLGLGDHFICNGLVRALAERYQGQPLHLFTLAHNLPSVAFMYRDLPSIRLISVKSIPEMAYILRYVPEHKKIVTGFYKDAPLEILLSLLRKVEKIGKDFLSYSAQGKHFDEIFYLQADIPFAERWDSFFVQRDKEAEERLFARISPGRPYIFVHEDSRFMLDKSRFNPKGLPVVYCTPSETPIIFDYCTLIERAEEVHGIESSVLHLIESLGLNPHTYAHRYPRFFNPWDKPCYRFIQHIEI